MDTKKSPEITVTQRMLEETRDELKSDLSSVRLEMKAGFEDIKADISGVRSDVNEVKSEIKALTAAVHRSLALHEEQNARNKYVLDGYQSLHDRQDTFEKKIGEDVASIKQSIARMNTTN